MSKNVIFVWFVLGLVLGIGGTYVVGPHYVKLAPGTIFAEMNVPESGALAVQAYKHESKPVAIYALSQHLIALKVAEKFSENPWCTPKRMILMDMMLAHGRLAKLYEETGQSDLSGQEVAEALRCAREPGNYGTITNQATLAEFVAKVDQNARH